MKGQERQKEWLYQGSRKIEDIAKSRFRVDGMENNSLIINNKQKYTLSGPVSSVAWVPSN